MQDKFYPLYTGIIVEPIEAKTESGLILTQQPLKQAKLAKVIRVGLGELNPDGTRTPVGVKEGETIAYYNQAPERHVMSEGKEYLLILEREVYGSYGSKEDE